MAKARPSRQRGVLEYPAHWFDPEDFISFIELRPFSRSWEGLGLNDEDLRTLQVTLMASPKSGQAIEGSGGVRKLRFSPAKWPKGKSGALRVCYVFVEEVGIVILALVYEKGAKEDIGAAELPILRAAVERVKSALLKKPYRWKARAES